MILVNVCETILGVCYEKAVWLMSSLRYIQSSASVLKRTDKIFATVFKVDDWSARGGRCHYCRERIPRAAVTADHATAKAKGGTTNRENIKASCFRCNNAKGTLSEAQFMGILHSPNAPRDLNHIAVWARFRLERQRQRLLRRICKYAGLPPEFAE